MMRLLIGYPGHYLDSQRHGDLAFARAAILDPLRNPSI